MTPEAQSASDGIPASSPIVSMERATLRITQSSRLTHLLDAAVWRSAPGLTVQVEGLPPDIQLEAWLTALVAKARRMGIHFAIVSPIRAVRRTARRLGLPVFGSQSAAQRHWENAAAKRGNRRRNRRGTSRIAADGLPRPAAPDRQRALDRGPAAGPSWFAALGITAMVLTVLGACGVFVYWIMPSATVTVYPAPATLEAEIPMTASLYVSTPDAQFGLVPAQYLSVSHEIVSTRPTTGERLVPVTAATGRVLVSNLTDNLIEVPAGTVIQTGTGQAIQFVTTAATVIFAGTGNQSLVPIEAVEPGETGNVPANSINTVQNNFAFRINVTNPEPTSGGESDWQDIVIQQDQDTLREQMLEEARRNAYAILVHEVPAGHWLPPDSLRVEVQWTTTDLFNDELSSDLTMTMMVLISGLTIDTDDLVPHALNQVKEQVPVGSQLIAPSLSFILDPETVNGPTEVGFTIMAAADYVPPVDTERIRRQVAGLSLAEVQTLLEADSFRQPSRIVVQPARATAMPFLSQRIQVEAEYHPDS